jgi:DNA anti-recombination protein RmuC
MSIRQLAVALSLISTLALAACGSDGETTSTGQATTSAGSGEQAEADVTPAQARAEIGEVRAALDSALASLKEGDAKTAENAVSEGYLQHFEKVEAPLAKVDEELNERLEETIREDLRDRIRDGGSVTEVTKMVSAIKSDLDTAEQKLR